MTVSLIGWLASIILFITVILQIREQWRRESNEAVSKWLFVGQLAASLGFFVYSLLTGDAVFAVTNCFLSLANLVGIFIYWRNEQ